MFLKPGLMSSDDLASFNVNEDDDDDWREARELTMSDKAVVISG